jgi:hypothetical protein
MKDFLYRWFPRLLNLIWVAIQTFARNLTEDIYTAIEIAGEIRQLVASSATADEINAWFDGRADLHKKAIRYALRVHTPDDIASAIAELSIQNRDSISLYIARQIFVSLIEQELPDSVADLLVQICYTRQKHQTQQQG